MIEERPKTINYYIDDFFEEEESQILLSFFVSLFFVVLLVAYYITLSTNYLSISINFSRPKNRCCKLQDQSLPSCFHDMHSFR